MSNSSKNGQNDEDVSFASRRDSEDASLEDGAQASLSNEAGSRIQREVSEVEAESLQLKEELRESKERYLRLMAEFDNFRKQKLKERSDLLKYQGEQLIVELLDIVDTFELAQKYDTSDERLFREGVLLISKKFSEMLERWGVKGESAIGKVFDPAIHNAISQIPTAAATEGTVVEELKKTYFYKDKVVRVGDVIVAVSPNS